MTAYPDSETTLPKEDKLETFVADLFERHPSLSAVRFWRVLVSGLIAHFDDHLENDIRKTEKLYDDVMDRLREQP